MRSKTRRLAPGVHIFVLAAAALTFGTCAAPAIGASPAPLKELLIRHLGKDVNKKGGDICATGEECQPGVQGAGPGQFSFASGIAAGSTGDVYIGDNGNNRVQELTPTGEFILMFGDQVNRKGGDICTKAEEGECQAGSEGTGPTDFKEPESVVVDPAIHRIYVIDVRNSRVQEFTEGGEFVLMFGDEVNVTRTTAIKAKGGTVTAEEEEEENICTAVSKDQCGSGKRGSGEVGKPYAFNFPSSRGGLIAVGGPALEHGLGQTVYVGDEHRVKKFTSEGKYTGELSLEGLSSEKAADVLALAATSSGKIYLTYGSSLTAVAGTTIYQFEADGDQVVTECTPEVRACWPIVLHPKAQDPAFITVFEVSGLAVDSEGRLAIAVTERPSAGEGDVSSGLLVDGVTARPTTTFSISPAENSSGLTMVGSDEIYLVGKSLAQEVLIFKPVPVGEAEPTKGECVAGAVNETNVSLNCELKGVIDPYGVSHTLAWFEWGRTPALGEVTPKEEVCSSSCPSTPIEVSHLVGGVRPGEGSFYYTVKLEDENIFDEPIGGAEVASFPTPTVAPVIVGPPTAIFVKPASVILAGRLNPESSSTTYEFRYAQAASCESEERERGEAVKLDECPGIRETVSQRSNAYGEISASAEVVGLQPGTTYRDDLRAVNAGNQEADDEGNESSFTTAPAARVQVQTGLPSTVGSTSAVISGSVQDGERPATYTFELGLANGEATSYGSVFSGEVDASTTPVREALQITGLQPGTRYEYRISARTGDGGSEGTTATSAPEGFRTETIASLPPVATLPLLPVPAIEFPQVKGKPRPPAKCKRGYVRNKRGRCIKAKGKRSGGARRAKSKAPRRARITYYGNHGQMTAGKAE